MNKLIFGLFFLASVVAISYASSPDLESEHAPTILKKKIYSPKYPSGSKVVKGTTSENEIEKSHDSPPKLGTGPGSTDHDLAASFGPLIKHQKGESGGVGNPAIDGEDELTREKRKSKSSSSKSKSSSSKSRSSSSKSRSSSSRSRSSSSRSRSRSSSSSRSRSSFGGSRSRSRSRSRSFGGSRSFGRSRSFGGSRNFGRSRSFTRSRSRGFNTFSGRRNNNRIGFNRNFGSRSRSRPIFNRNRGGFRRRNFGYRGRGRGFGGYGGYGGFENNRNRYNNRYRYPFRNNNGFGRNFGSSFRTTRRPIYRNRGFSNNNNWCYGRWGWYRGRWCGNRRNFG